MQVKSKGYEQELSYRKHITCQLRTVMLKCRLEVT